MRREVRVPARHPEPAGHGPAERAYPVAVVSHADESRALKRRGNWGALREWEGVTLSQFSGAGGKTAHGGHWGAIFMHKQSFCKLAYLGLAGRDLHRECCSRSLRPRPGSRVFAALRRRGRAYSCAERSGRGAAARTCERGSRLGV